MHKKYHQAEKKKMTLWSSQNSRDENDDFKKYQQLVTGLDKALTCLDDEICDRKLLFLGYFLNLTFFNVRQPLKTK